MSCSKIIIVYSEIEDTYTPGGLKEGFLNAKTLVHEIASGI